MKSILKIFIVLSLLYGCKKEEFKTKILIQFDSGFRNLKVEPTPILITSYFVDMNKEYRKVLHTIYTDSFGNYQNTIQVKKPGKKEFYKIEMEESLWLLPLNSSQEFTAGFENEITFRVLPKWRNFIVLNDTSGKFKPYGLSIKHNLSTNYQGINYQIKDFPALSNQSYLMTAPTDAFITVNLSLININNNKAESKTYKFNSNTSNNIWVNF